MDNARQGFFERADFEKMRAELQSETAKNVTTFAYLTGWRTRSEILPLTWDRVDFKAGVVRLEVRQSKNGKGRTFPFRCHAGPDPARLPPDGGRNLVRAGVSESVAMQICGHKTRKIFDRYSIVSERDLREGVVKLAAVRSRTSRDDIGRMPATEERAHLGHNLAAK